MPGRSKLFRTASVVNKCLMSGKSCHSSVENPPVATVTFMRASKDWHRFPSLHPTSLPSPPFTNPLSYSSPEWFPSCSLTHWARSPFSAFTKVFILFLECSSPRFPPGSLPYRLRVFDQKLPSGNALSIHPGNCNPVHLQPSTP